MTPFSLLLLAIGLCFDTFAVSLSGGIDAKHSLLRIAKISAVFALSQTAMLTIGWLLGTAALTYIAPVDHWIAFGLLAFIGGKMIRESFNPGPASTNLANHYVLLIIALATSIDAIAVGVSLACSHILLPMMGIAALFVLTITTAAAVAGLLGGRRLGARVGKRAEIIGGIILIAIGVKILLEHLMNYEL
ncbi:MAG: manganese efflux pump MntP family protein [Prevotellaceae bacterium]|jgi:putative Mn2+ efflux pump MntP|nr:manganese efflux pump MntP family protein [Prevotellaceae bacterium]